MGKQGKKFFLCQKLATNYNNCINIVYPLISQTTPITFVYIGVICGQNEVLWELNYNFIPNLIFVSTRLVYSGKSPFMIQL